MKKIYFYLILLSVFSVSGQTLIKGNYISADGYYTISISHENNEITVTEPNKVSIYKSSYDNKYYHTEPKYAEYYIKVTGTKECYKGKKGGEEYLFNYSEEAPQEALAEGIENCELYEKYILLSEKNQVNDMIWRMCAAAALVKCTYNEQGVKDYIAHSVSKLKAILKDPSTCPCTDVISKAIWDAK